MTPFKDSQDGQTHHQNDGCGCPEHNDMEWEKEFDEILSCIQKERGCSNDGIIPEIDEDGDWEQTQCEYCYKVRFPVKDFIKQKLEQQKKEIIDELKKLNLESTKCNSVSETALTFKCGISEIINNIK